MLEKHLHMQACCMQMQVDVNILLVWCAYVLASGSSITTSSVQQDVDLCCYSVRWIWLQIRFEWTGFNHHWEHRWFSSKPIFVNSSRYCTSSNTQSQALRSIFAEISCQWFCDSSTTTTYAVVVLRYATVQSASMLFSLLLCWSHLDMWSHIT